MESRVTQVARKGNAVDLSTRDGLLNLIASLRHGAERARTGLYFVEGSKMVGEAISKGAAVQAVVIVPEMRPKEDVLPRHWTGVAPLVVEVGRRRYEHVARHFALKQGPQGIGAIVRQSWTAADRFVLPQDGVAVALSSVQDAGNLGSILRTCDAVGCCAVILLGEGADPYGPVSVRASLGSIFTQSLIRADMQGLIGLAGRSGARVIGTSPHSSKTYRAVRYRRPVILLLGNEAKGLSDEEMSLCHEVVSIPMAGHRDSLNVSVAGAIILYEAFCQYRETQRL